MTDVESGEATAAKTIQDQAVMEHIRRFVAPYTMGFLKVGITGKRETALNVGSGTFVKIGAISGILTASHVLEQLPKEGDVGLVYYSGTGRSRMRIDLGTTERIVIGSRPFVESGPDIAFLRLAPLTIATLSAMCSFHNLSLRSTKGLAKIPEGQRGIDVIAGVVDELTTTEIDQAAKMIRMNVHSLLEIGKIEKLDRPGELDYLRFSPLEEADYVPPESYGGMSGGGLWRTFCTIDSAGEITPKETLIWGVAFHQSDVRQGYRKITCHGPKSIYRVFIDEIAKKWPQANG